MDDLRPIPQHELISRLSAVRSALQEQSYSMLIVPLGVYFNYFFGKTGNPSERIIAGIIPVDDDPFILSPTFEKSNIINHTYIDDIVTWEETDTPYDILAESLKDRHLSGKIAVDPRFWVYEVELMARSTGEKFESVAPILYQLRQVKTEWELRQMRKAAEYSTKGILDALNHLEEGMTELEFMEILGSKLTELSGVPSSFSIVQFGENSAIPHGRPTTRKLKRDEVVLIDAGTSVNGYHGDITITVPYGNPEGFKEIYEIVYEANRKAFDADKEGAIPAELDRIARDHISDKGYGKFFTHRLGHGLGLDVHEEPYIVGNNNQPLVSGNTHTIEPGIYQPGKFGVRIEDDVVVQGNRAELLYNTPRYNFE